MMFSSIRRWVVLPVAVLAITTLVLLSQSATFAQDQGGAPAGAQPVGAPSAPPILGLNDPQNPFHLTATQQEEGNAIKLKFQQDANAIMQNTSIPGAEKQPKIQALQASASAKLKAILSPTQRAIVDSINAKQSQMMAISNKARAIMATLTSSVTPAQKAKLQQIQANAQAQAAAIQNSTSSTAVKNDEIDSLKTQFQSQVATVLASSTQRSYLRQINQLQKQLLAIEKQLQQASQ